MVIVRAVRVLWLPSLFVGMALSVSVGTAAGILLFNADGLFRAALTLLTVGLFAFGMGYAVAVRDANEIVLSAAKWWAAFLVSLAFGAAFVGVWEAAASLRAASFAQPLGLGVVCAMPGYFAGGVMGRMVQWADHLRIRGLRGRVVLGAAAGVGLGTALVWFALGKVVLAVTAVLGAAILASLGARILGWIVDRVPQRSLLMVDEDRPELRFETWTQAVPKMTTHVLWENGASLLHVPPQPGSWPEAVALHEDDASDGGLFFLGVGGWRGPEPGVSWVLHEPDDGVLALAKEGLGWKPECLLDSPLPPPGPTIAVIDRASALGLFEAGLGLPDYLAALADQGILRVWVGGDRKGRLPDLLPAVEAMGVRVAEYTARVPAQSSPFATSPRWQTLRLFEMGDHGGVEIPLPRRVGQFVLVGEDSQ